MNKIKTFLFNKKFLATFVVFSFFFLLPLFVSAQGLAIKCNTDYNEATGTYNDPCDFVKLMDQIKTVIDFLLFRLTLPLVAILFAYAGYLYATVGFVPGNKAKAKSIFWGVLWGFIIALSAWLIVQAVLWGLGVSQDYSLLKDIKN